MEREDYYYDIGESLQTQDSCSVIPFESRYHFHENYEIYLFLSGNVDYYIEENHYQLQRGHLFVMNDKEIHRVSVHDSSPYRRVVVHFDRRMVTMMNTPTTNILACFRDHQPGIGNALVVNETQLQDICAKIDMLGEVSKSSTYGSDVLAIACLAELLVKINGLFNQIRLESPERSSSLIGEIIQYIASNLDRKLTLDLIADQFLIDKFYLSHLFHAETGDTVYQYILIKKIAIAKRFLSEGKTVSETCDLAGFNNYNNFIRTFKKIAGTTPGRYITKTYR